ncbi:hypothetical protein [Mycobacterium sp. JS623]|uniref:hypothetical protein n=1 Tax=Mycobacterium sp. JS623 TaxID=212767 RepID=UPI0012F799BB|nr:hypothetical protein [Mycobacterium sp. JS623]
MLVILLQFCRRARIATPPHHSADSPGAPAVDGAAELPEPHEVLVVPNGSIGEIPNIDAFRAVGIEHLQREPEARCKIGALLAIPQSNQIVDTLAHFCHNVNGSISRQRDEDLSRVGEQALPIDELSGQDLDRGGRLHSEDSIAGIAIGYVHRPAPIPSG